MSALTSAYIYTMVTTLVLQVLFILENQHGFKEVFSLSSFHAISKTGFLCEKNVV